MDTIEVYYPPQSFKNRAETTTLSLFVGFGVVAVRAMPATTFTAIAPFEMVLFGKDLISFLRKVKITFLQWNDFFHAYFI